jgi:hypothetical protein
MRYQQQEQGDRNGFAHGHSPFAGTLDLHAGGWELLFPNLQSGSA